MPTIITKKDKVKILSYVRSLVRENNELKKEVGRLSAVANELSSQNLRLHREISYLISK